MAKSRHIRAVWLVAAVTAGGLVILLLATTAPIAHAAGSASAQRAFKHCGRQHQTAPNWYRVRAHNVGCREARHVARHFWRSGGDSHFEGWSCHSRQIGDEVWKARCTRQRRGRLQIVRFHYGA
jgi:hypothetical protein